MPAKKRASKARSRTVALVNAKSEILVDVGQKPARKGRKRLSAVERVQCSVAIDMRTGCHISSFCDSKNGYPEVGDKCPDTGKQIKRRACKVVLEHKLGRSLEKGEITRHTCHNRKCVNPEHLIPGSKADNYADAVAAGVKMGRKLNANLAAQIADALVLAVGEGEKIKVIVPALSAEYGVCQQTIFNVWRGKTYSKYSGIREKRAAMQAKKVRSQMAVVASESNRLMGINRRTAKLLHEAASPI